MKYTKSEKRPFPKIAYFPVIFFVLASPGQEANSIFAIGSLLSDHLWIVGQAPRTPKFNLLKHFIFVGFHYQPFFLHRGCHQLNAVGNPSPIPSSYNLDFEFRFQWRMIIHSQIRQNPRDPQRLQSHFDHSLITFFASWYFSLGPCS